MWLVSELIGKALVYLSPTKGMVMKMPSCAIHLLMHVVCWDIFETFHIFAHSGLCRFQWSANSSWLLVFFLLEFCVHNVGHNILHVFQLSHILHLLLLSISRVAEWILFNKDCYLLYKIWQPVFAISAFPFDLPDGYPSIYIPISVSPLRKSPCHFCCL